jgi:hypothetical protein
MTVNKLLFELGLTGGPGQDLYIKKHTKDKPPVEINISEKINELCRQKWEEGARAALDNFINSMGTDLLPKLTSEEQKQFVKLLIDQYVETPFPLPEFKQ